MNCFTHALPFLERENPYFIVGTCIPDWLSAADRKCRAREKGAAEFASDKNHELASLAQGIVQHHQDDHWFHQTRTFVDLSMTFAVELRTVLAGDAGFRPGLLGHILIEVLLDAYLHLNFPGKLDKYYSQVLQVTPKVVEQFVNKFATRPTEKLAYYIEKFLEAKYLFDYVDDATLMMRINNVLKRAKLRTVDDQVTGWLPTARERVYAQVSGLLDGYPLSV